jgi:hypothetical protein
MNTRCVRRKANDLVHAGSRRSRKSPLLNVAPAPGFEQLREIGLTQPPMQEPRDHDVAAARTLPAQRPPQQFPQL